MNTLGMDLLAHISLIAHNYKVTFNIYIYDLHP